MGKINKNIKVKAKAAVTKAAGVLPQNKIIKHFVKTTNKLSGAGASTDKSRVNDKVDLLLHKTNKPKRTISKKDKLRVKHKNLMQKFVSLKKVRKEEKAAKNRAKTAVVGDLKPLKDALPSLNELFRLSKEKNSIKTGLPESEKRETGEQAMSAKEKLKRRKNKFISQVKSYEALLQDPDFKKNPRDIIAYHIKYTHGLIDE